MKDRWTTSSRAVSGTAAYNDELTTETMKTKAVISVLGIALAALPWLTLDARPSESRPEDTTECRAHLEKIHTAIQEYRKDNKCLPDYFHDLVPRFISDTNLFLCPQGSRDKIEPRYPWLGDPTLPSHYLYEFSARPCEQMWGGGKTTMAEWKALEMSVVGGIVPMVRCCVHNPVLNVSFDGKFYESEPAWEMEHADKVNPEDLIPSGLRLRLSRILQSVDPETLAFDRLEYDSSKVGRLADECRAATPKRKPHPDLPARALAVAKEATHFQEEYPKSDKVSDARALHRAMIWTAAWAGDLEARRTFDEMVQSAKAQGLPVQERLELRLLALVMDGADGKDGALDPPARALIQEFPKEAAAYWFLLSLAQESPDEFRRRSIAAEILKMDGAPAEVKQQARAALDPAHR